MTIPRDPWLLLAYERNGRPLDPSTYEKGTGRLAGEGPYRLIKPQRDLGGDPKKPGRPDRSLKAKTFGDGWDFVPGMDHNAGACVRGACVIRVNPMPEGYEEYDWKNGWPLIGDKKVVIYGYGDQVLGGEAQDRPQEDVSALFQVVPIDPLAGRVADPVGRGDEDHARVAGSGQDLSVVAGPARDLHRRIAERPAFLLDEAGQPRRDRDRRRLIDDPGDEAESPGRGDVLGEREDLPSRSRPWTSAEALRNSSVKSARPGMTLKDPGCRAALPTVRTLP